MFFQNTELDEAAQAELDAIRGNLAKYKGKYGKEIGIDELDWVGIKNLPRNSLKCPLVSWEFFPFCHCNQPRTLLITLWENICQAYN